MDFWTASVNFKKFEVSLWEFSYGPYAESVVLQGNQLTALCVLAFSQVKQFLHFSLSLKYSQPSPLPPTHTQRKLLIFQYAVPVIWLYGALPELSASCGIYHSSLQAPATLYRLYYNTSSTLNDCTFAYMPFFIYCVYLKYRDFILELLFLLLSL